MFTVADAAQPLFASINKDGAGSGDFAPTEVEKEAIAYALNQAMQGMVQYAKPTTFARQQRLRIRPPETVELETDYRGKITSVDVSTAPSWGSTTHVSSVGGYLQFIFGADIRARIGDRIKVTGGTSTYEGYHNITAVESNAAGTTCTITTSTASSVSLTANVATVARALQGWMRGCTVTGAGLDNYTTDTGNRFSRDLTKLLDDDDSNYPLGGVDVTVLHDHHLLDDNVRGILSDPKRRVINGQTAAQIWTEKDGADGAPRLYLRWNPLAEGEAVQVLQFWTYGTPRAIKASELDSAAATWTAELPLQAPANFFETWLIPIATQHLVQRLQFSSEEANSQEGVLAEIYRQYQEAVSRLVDWESGQEPDQVSFLHV